MRKFQQVMWDASLLFTATLTSLMVGDDSNQATDNLKLYIESRLNDIDKRLDKISRSNEKE